MITFSRVKSSLIEKGSRIIKVLQFGAKTAVQSSSFGDDSCPLNEMTAIYADTSEKSERLIIGYINKDQIASPGEKRIFSLNTDGSFSCSIHLKSDGVCEIGEALDFSVRHTQLNTSIAAKDALIITELGKIAAAINAIVPGSYTPGTISTDISSAKVEKTKI